MGLEYFDATAFNNSSFKLMFKVLEFVPLLDPITPDLELLSY